MSNKMKYPRHVFEEEVLQEIYDGKFGAEPDVTKAKVNDMLMDELSNEYDLCALRHMTSDDAMWVLEKVFERVDDLLKTEYEVAISMRHMGQDHE